MIRPMRRVVMLSRRGAVKRALLAAAFLATLAPRAHAAPSEAQLGQAAAFVRQAGGEMAALVTTPTPMAQRKQRLRGLIDQVVDVPAVARFCLGRFWRPADQAQRAQYVALFQDVLVNSVADRMGDYPSGSVRVEIGRPYAAGDEAVVPTTIVRPDNPTVSVAWTVSFSTGAPRIVDVSAEGMSLRLTERNDYASYLLRHGGDVGALIAALRRQAGKG